MTEHPVAQLRFKPCALGGHDSARVRDRHQLLNPRRKHGERARVLAAVHQLLQLRRAPDSAHEVNRLARSGIIDSEYRLQDVRLQQAHVEGLNWVFRGSELWPKAQRAPLAFQIESKLVTRLRLWFTFVADVEHRLKFLQQLFRRFAL